jgi:GDPmannose 4,6-dehydratase
MKTALITGITGQDGPYLAEFLLSKNYRVIGFTLDKSEFQMRNLKYLGLKEKVELFTANLLDLSNIIRIIDKTNPDEIYHLAAQSSVGLSFEQPIGTLEFNIISTANMLEAIRIINSKIRFYNASSSEMYGNVMENQLPVTEESVLHPVSPYGISKAAAHWITINYRQAYGLFATCGILFNHESVLRGDNFVTKKILNAAVKIKIGIEKELVLGNVNIYRDWGFAPEYVKAMWLMLQQDKPDDFVICSGEHHSLEEFTRTVFQKLDLTYDKYVKFDEREFRPVDLSVIFGDNSKAKKILKWNYDFKFDELIEQLINDEKKYIEWVLQNGKSY